MALISVVTPDRQLFRSYMGLPDPWASLGETPLSHSFCRFVVASKAPLEVVDARSDPRFCGSPALVGMGFCSYLGVPIRSQSGEVLGSLCVLDRHPRQWDRSDLQTLEDLRDCLETQLAQMRRPEAVFHPPTPPARIAQLTAALDHELRTPLNGLWNLSERLKDCLQDTAWSELAADLQRSAHRLTHLVEDLLELAALQNGRPNLPRAVEVASFLHSLSLDRPELGRPRGRSIIEPIADHPHGSSPTYAWDEGRVRNALRRLLNLALEKGEVRLRTICGESSVRFVFEPTPAPTEGGPDLYALFQRTLPESDRKLNRSDLDLKIARFHLQDLAISVRPGAEPGSAILELSTQRVTPCSDRHRADTGISFQRILVVDDDQTNLRVLKHLAEKLELDMTCVDSGLAALDQLRHRSYDLVLLDLRMPGMDGFEVARQIREELKLDIPIVAVTADNLEETKAATARSGMVGFLAKPIRSRDLAALLSQEGA